MYDILKFLNYKDDSDILCTHRVLVLTAFKKPAFLAATILANKFAKTGKFSTFSKAPMRSSVNPGKANNT